jgi:RNA 3'-terminal phosphate cyclase (ATP)
MTTMIAIDGAMGEGGGQILRTSLALALLTGTPFHVTGIRAGRKKPGLMRQHLVAVRAAAAIGDAEVVGDELGSTELRFTPGAIRAGDHAFRLGGAGSTTLVFQTVLWPLLLGATAPSTLSFEGGTHNPMSPPYDFLVASFLSLLARMGGRVDVTFARHGFYPAGGGAWTATIHPAPLSRLELLERGAITARSATAIVSQIPGAIAVRELDTLTARLGWDRAWASPRVVKDAAGPGNVLLATIASAHVTEVVTGFGERGVRAEAVAEAVAAETARYLRADVPVGEHLADQLLLPMALGGGGAFRTLRPSGHTTTQLALLRRFLGVTITTTEEAEDVWRIEVPAS